MSYPGKRWVYLSNSLRIKKKFSLPEKWTKKSRDANSLFKFVKILKWWRMDIILFNFSLKIFQLSLKTLFNLFTTIKINVGFSRTKHRLFPKYVYVLICFNSIAATVSLQKQNVVQHTAKFYSAVCRIAD